MKDFLKWTVIVALILGVMAFVLIGVWAYIIYPEIRNKFNPVFIFIFIIAWILAGVGVFTPPDKSFMNPQKNKDVKSK